MRKCSDIRLSNCFCSKYTITILLLLLITAFLTSCAGKTSGSGNASEAEKEVAEEGVATDAVEESAAEDAAIEETSAGGSLKADAGKGEGTAEESAVEDAAAEETATSEASLSGTAAETADLQAAEESLQEPSRVILGDEQFDVYLPLLEGKRVALYTNQTGIVGNQTVGAETIEAIETSRAGLSESRDPVQEAFGEMSVPAENIPFGQKADGASVEYGPHILDALLERGANVALVFSPEHGFRGEADAGAQVEDSVDEKTGVPVRSLYRGSSGLSGSDLDKFDTLLVDIQDVGLRYYTYYITLYNLMDACAAAGKEVVILDRPNPNGFYVDGPILRDEFRSGVGLLPIPIVHGMTLGELAQMINGEGWLDAGRDACRLTVIPCKNYTHQTKTSLIVRPSPNLKDMRAVWLYSSTCIFENTVVSVGRGTEYPFTIYGSPYFEGLTRVQAENEDSSENSGTGLTISPENNGSGQGDSPEAYYSYSFIPVSMPGATSPPFQGQTCYGRSLRSKPLEQILTEQIHLEYLIEAYEDFHAVYPEQSFFGSPDGAGHYWIDYLCGTDDVRGRIEAGETAAQIKASWQEEIATFREERRPYLLYVE